MAFNEKHWADLTRKYPERAGRAYELYLADKKKQANPTTYFKFAGLKEKRDETRYRTGLEKYTQQEKLKMELKND